PCRDRVPDGPAPRAPDPGTAHHDPGPAGTLGGAAPRPRRPLAGRGPAPRAAEGGRELRRPDPPADRRLLPGDRAVRLQRRPVPSPRVQRPRYGDLPRTPALALPGGPDRTRAAGPQGTRPRPSYGPRLHAPRVDLRTAPRHDLPRVPDL